ncbi:ABC transporter ATP-binding protein [Bacillus sp. FJAT-22090]|uniref:ABC transporter ATP-binding protein n=1 Tax=Bacillus sp. FJAT-22090 TaxID=1581038 RepID=UPI0021B48E14|nr:ATP-binding cassette domain-containing protein [Bacillus sp. FJAT-22090]
MHEVIQFEKVSFRYPDEEKWILKDLSFAVQRGERVVITGPSGCGKTTLLYLCNRLYPDNCDGILSGSVILFEKESHSFIPGEINHRIATVFQDPDAQFCMQTVEEELAFTLENLHTKRDDMEKRISDVLSLTELTEFRRAVIQKLSGGQKQRIATACALIMEPEILLLDEPLSHLDPYTAKKYVEWLSDLQQKQEMTIVAIEHRLDLWGDFFNRTISLNKNEAAPSIQKRISSKQEATSLVVNKLKTTTFLRETTFHLRCGEITVLAGPNGSGKSTLLKALCQLIPSSGNVQPNYLGYVPQSPEFLFLTKNVRDEIGFGGGNNLEEMLTRLQLLPIADAHPFAVSHGQKRRVAIAAMLCDGREIILMDEPTSGQDAAALSELFQLINERACEGTTFLIVTHDMEFAHCLADSIILMKDGYLTGKFNAEAVWQNEQLLQDHHLLPPKGMILREECFT